MNDLRTAAQQALEALETDPVKANAINNATAFLRAALAEPVQAPVAGNTLLKEFLAAAKEAGVTHLRPAEPESTCNGMPAIEGPLSRSQRMREAGFTRRPKGWVKDGDGPVQEPVAFKDAPKRVWLQACEDDHCEVSFREHAEITWCAEQQNPLDVPYVRADLAAPPQRKPLTDEEIMDLCASKWASHPVEVAKLIERAHGIGGQQ